MIPQLSIFFFILLRFGNHWKPILWSHRWHFQLIVLYRLPMSHTCFNQLVLPAYRSKRMMKQKLMIAIQNAEGFGLEWSVNSNSIMTLICIFETLTYTSIHYICCHLFCSVIGFYGQFVNVLVATFCSSHSIHLCLFYLLTISVHVISSRCNLQFTVAWLYSIGLWYALCNGAFSALQDVIESNSCGNCHRTPLSVILVGAMGFVLRFLMLVFKFIFY